MQEKRVNQNKITKTFQYGQHEVKLETGRIAKQAFSVMASMGDTIVLATAVGRPDAEPMSFLPLTIDYEERTYAAGKIPGGFFKREGRPSEKAVLTCRLIDRPMRPLFPKGFAQEVQVVVTVLSLDPEINADVVAMLAASAAVQISGIPFDGPMGACRVGFIDGRYVLNPSASQLDKQSRLDLVVAGTEDAVLMVESEADILTEQEMLGAVMFGHENLAVACKTINEMANEAGRQVWDWQAPESDETLTQQVKDAAYEQVLNAYMIAEKTQRQEQLRDIREKIINEFADEDEEKGDEVYAVISSLEKEIVRSRILAGESRIDGRDTKTVRPIDVELGLLPRTHGSALFTRGETQALVVATLGTERDAQLIDAIEGEHKQPFMLHYNFPPYCVGEVGRVGSPKRREIGHGNLAKRGVAAVLPDPEDFPYVIRVVSEITESNGSSSMASVCGTSLSLMDAGVNIKAPVAGVAMGLIKEDDRYSVLTDILGDEDHLGDMDFKVAGTSSGVTALQMDIKIQGITKEIMEIALEQAREGRLHILSEMAKAIDAPRAEMSDYAPRIITIKIPTDKIRDVIGKGGATIRSISEETGATIDIDDDGTVNIASVDNAAGQEAKKRIEDITADVEVGKIYNGRVVKLMDFGAFVNILPGRDGLLHISQISSERVEKVSDELSEGDFVNVKVLEVDKQGRIRLSKKAITVEEAAQA